VKVPAGEAETVGFTLTIWKQNSLESSFGYKMGPITVNWVLLIKEF